MIVTISVMGIFLYLYSTGLLWYVGDKIGGEVDHIVDRINIAKDGLKPTDSNSTKYDEVKDLPLVPPSTGFQVPQTNCIQGGKCLSSCAPERNCYPIG